MAGQIERTIKQLSATLVRAGSALADVAQIRIFTTDIDEMKKNHPKLLDLLAQANCRSTSLLAQVGRPSDSDTLHQIETGTAQ